MQTNATQIARAIAQLYALTGSFDHQGKCSLTWAPANVEGRNCCRPKRPLAGRHGCGPPGPHIPHPERQPTRAPVVLAPTCCSRTPTGDVGARPWPRWISTSTRTCL
jgi:hypothetical protein